MIHVLLVDDEAELRTLLADYLERYGLRVTTLATGAELRRTVTSGPPYVGNLLANALRYGGAAEVSVTREASELRIQVTDRGPGIAPDQLEAVLQPYYRLDASRQQGTGLGLYIARDLAQRNGGRLSLANRPGGGLQATLSLPLA